MLSNLLLIYATTSVRHPPAYKKIKTPENPESSVWSLTDPSPIPRMSFIIPVLLICPIRSALPVLITTRNLYLR